MERAVKMIFDLAEGPEGDLEQAIRQLMDWYNGPAHSPAGTYILVMDGTDPPHPPKFGWQITGIEFERNVSEVPGPELMAAIREEQGRS